MSFSRFRSVGRIVVAFGLAAVFCAAVAFAGNFGGFGPRTDIVAPTSSPTWSPGLQLAAADMDRDGHIDVVVRGQSAFTIFFNDGAGGLVAGQTYAAPGSTGERLIVRDLSGDGYPDVAWVLQPSGENILSIWLNKGDGTLGARIDYDTMGDTSTYLAASDLTGNGALDIAVANRNSGTVTVFMNDGTGQFTLSELLAPSNASVIWVVALGDIDGDGDVDLLVATDLIGTSNARRLHGYRNDGAGNLTPDQSVLAMPSTVSAPLDMALVDIDLDGDLDLLFTLSASLYVMINNGAGGFAPFVGYPVGAIASQLSIADVNGNGLPDVAVGKSADSGTGFQTAVLINDGMGGYGDPIQFSNAGSGPRSSPAVVLADLDGNTTPDLFSTSRPQFSAHLNWRLNLTDVLPPGEFDLLSPPDNTVGLPLPEALTAWPGGGGPAPVWWSLASGFQNQYRVLLATDLGMKSIILDEVVSGLSFNLPAGLLQVGTAYYWTVIAENPVGQTEASMGPFKFTTRNLADLTNSGSVGSADLAILLGAWGSTP